MATTTTATERHRPTTLRAAVRRLFTLASNPPSETHRPVGIFDRARNVSFQNATFTINQYGGIVPEAVVALERQSSEDDSTSRSSPHQGYREPLPSPQRESPDVYVDCLLSEKRGYPLWTPSPDMSLPVLHRTLGISLGDVGVLNPEGGFDFLFNIFHDASHPLNTFFGVPEGFVHFKRPEGSGTREYVEWNAGYYISNPRMGKVNTDSSVAQSNGETVLQSKATEAAVLMTPEDVYGARMDITQSLLKYIEDNVIAWYTFAKVTLGRTDIHNGDLRVIYGHRKSTGFGIATTFNSDLQTHTELKFSKDNTWADMHGCAYRWSHTGCAEVKAGPTQQETSELGSTEPVRNQCLFIRTIDAKVSTTIWQQIEDLEIGAPVNENLDATSDTSPHQDGSARHSTKKSLNPKGNEYISASTHQHHERVFHPSVILHDILETMAPGLPVYIVCNDDWESMLEKNIQDMDVSDFVGNVFTNKSIVEQHGMAYFSDDSDDHILDKVPECVAKIRFSQSYGNKEEGSLHGQGINSWKAKRTITQQVSSAQAAFPEFIVTQSSETFNDVRTTLKGSQRLSSAQPTFPAIAVTQASQLPDDVWTTLEGDQVNANAILSTLDKCRAREQAGRPTQRHLWVVVYSPAPHSRVLYVASCNDGYLGKYPVLLYTTTPASNLRSDDIAVTAPLSSIAQALLTGVGSRRVYSVFGPAVLAEAFCRIWTSMTRIEQIAQPYHECKLSFANRRTFRDASDQRISQGHISVRPATAQDIPQIAHLCHQFAQESPPFVLTQAQALQEANYLFANRLVWVLTVIKDNVPPEVATMVAFTRNSKDAATITKVFTPVQHRGNKYAETLVREVTRHFLGHGGKLNVALYVGVTSMAANVFRRVGFVGIEPKAPPVDTVDRWIEYGFDRNHVDLGHW